MSVSHTTSMGVKLDAELRQRLHVLGQAKQRSPHWLMREAIREYVKREEDRLRHNQETVARWEQYQMTDEAVDDEAVAAWLDTWGEAEEAEWPQRD